ncbi:MAG TPA: hypothetical protein VL240_10510 [Candidatus Binatia bacterium]|nr:hypothetical protein [Candidatus Binatia bacterium]
MRQKVPWLVVLLLLLSPFSLLAKSSSHSGHSSHSSKSTHSSKARTDSAGKTEHVNGYYRKDGTYVAPYERHPVGTAPHDVTTPHPVAAPVNTSTSGIAYRYKRDYLAQGYTADASVARDKHGKIKRSQAAKDEFKRENPCPANGNRSGKCPGYVIDHVQPLECGGADAPSNMQWQTVAEGKAKDRTERYCR